MSSTARAALPPAQVDCKWWKQGYCARGSKCYFRHDQAMAGMDNVKPESAKATGKGQDKANTKAPPPASSENTVNGAGPSPTENLTDASSSQICTICLEMPDTFGLLLNCDHVFCLECIRNWRSSTSAPLPSNEELRPTSKTCPMCRSHSPFIIPSSHFPLRSADDSLQDGENMAKKQVVDGYLSRLKNIPCRYFEQSVENSKPGFRPKCKFKNACHYAHIHPVTKEPYIFSAEEMSRPPRRPKRSRVGSASVLEEILLMDSLLDDLMLGYDSEEDDLSFFDPVPGLHGFSSSFHLGLDYDWDWGD